MNVRLLIVDDHQLFRDGLRAIFDDEPDIDVVGEAVDGRNAERLVAELQPDIVLMDVGMSEMNGMAATQRITSRFSDVTVLALSAHRDKRYVSGMLEAGARGYVTKVSAYEELRRAVRAVSQGRVYLSPEVAGDLLDEYLQLRLGEVADARDLSPRESEVLQLVAEGLTSGEVAERLDIATATVETHRRNLARKLDLHSVAEFTKCALRMGLTEIGD